jgi:hypothetical protein
MKTSQTKTSQTTGNPKKSILSHFKPILAKKQAKTKPNNKMRLKRAKKSFAVPFCFNQPQTNPKPKNRLESLKNMIKTEKQIWKQSH